MTRIWKVEPTYLSWQFVIGGFITVSSEGLGRIQTRTAGLLYALGLCASLALDLIVGSVLLFKPNRIDKRRVGHAV